MNRKAKLLISIAALLVFPEIALGCFVTPTPITQFDTSQYVFIGEVMGIVGPFETKYVKRQAWGLVVKVQDKVFLPKEPSNKFEVFPFGLGADCGSVGISQEALLKNFPIGSKIRVIAREAVAFKENVERGNIRLEIHPIELSGSGGTGSISRNDGDSTASVSSEYDYKSFSIENPFKMTPTEESTLSQLSFELRKDLLRLKMSKSEKGGIEILKRLAYYLDLYRPIDFAKIAESFTQDKRVVALLKKEREEWLRKNEEKWEQPSNNSFNPTPR